MPTITTVFVPIHRWVSEAEEERARNLQYLQGMGMEVSHEMLKCTLGRRWIPSYANEA